MPSCYCCTTTVQVILPPPDQSPNSSPREVKSVGLSFESPAAVEGVAAIETISSVAKAVLPLPMMQRENIPMSPPPFPYPDSSASMMTHQAGPFIATAPVSQTIPSVSAAALPMRSPPPAQNPPLAQNSPTIPRVEIFSLSTALPISSIPAKPSVPRMERIELAGSHSVQKKRPPPPPPPKFTAVEADITVREDSSKNEAVDMTSISNDASKTPNN